MNKRIDLHGYTESQAVMKISTALHAFVAGHEETIEFITGRGEVLRRVLEDFLQSEGLTWRHENNNYGSYTVFKRRRGAA